MKHVAGSEDGLTFVVHLPCRTFQIAVTSNNLLSLRIPYNQLLVAIFTGIEFIDIHRFTSASTRLSKSYLTQASNLFHHIRRIVSRHNIDLIVTLVGHTKLTIARQFAFKNFLGNGLDNLLFHYYWGF